MIKIKWLFLVFVVVCQSLCGESISIVEVPSRLPTSTSLGTYSPPIRFSYSGLQPNQTYTLKVWLLERSRWFHASSQWLERGFTLENYDGTNSAGTIFLIENMDVYGYSYFDWVLHLYNNATGSEVAFCERYVDGTANRPPVLAQIPQISGVVGQPLTLNLAASDPDGDPLVMTVDPIPPGASFDEQTGLFQWTPQTTGTNTFVVTACDGGEGNLKDAQIVSIPVCDGLCAETIAISEMPSKLPYNTRLGSYSPPICFSYAGLKPNQSYTLSVWLLNGSSPYHASSQWNERTFQLDNYGGTNSTGTIWIVENMDVYAYYSFVWALELYNNITKTQVAFTQANVRVTFNQPPTLAPIENPKATVGHPVTVRLTATDPNHDAISFSVSPMPSGATFDSQTGVFQWTPQTVGTYSFLFTASDNGDGALKDGQMVEINVIDQPQIIAEPEDLVLPLGATNAMLSVSAVSGLPLSYQWQFNGINIPNGTGSSLQIKPVGIAKSGGYRVLVSDSYDVVPSREAIVTVVTNRGPELSVQLSLKHLRSEMDTYHNRLVVYEDIGSGGNHFHARGQLPNERSRVGMNGSWTNRPHSGATCIRCTFTNTCDFGGFYFLNGILLSNAPLPYFGETTVAGTTIPVTNYTGLNLKGATNLTFWARGETGNEQIQFFVGGVGRDAQYGFTNSAFPDSTRRIPREGTMFRLGTNWQKFVINLAGLNLTNIMGGFAWVADAAHNTNASVTVFYLDDIQYNFGPTRLAQSLNSPRFIRSYVTKPVQGPGLDFVLRNTAFLYDNALAVLSFLADNNPVTSPDSLRRARLIGDAMVYASRHDRTYTDGRLRTAYAAGDLSLPPGWTPNGKSGTVFLPGFYQEDTQSFAEVENADIDTGNNAWGMIALLALHKRTHNPAYLETAINIGNFIHTLRTDGGPYQGFCGGIKNAETATPIRRGYASSEHNIDLVAAFQELYRLTQTPQWQADAQHAREFVEAMWSQNAASDGAYLTGTADPPLTRNESVLPLDCQSWSILSLSNALSLHPNLLRSVESAFRITTNGFSGFDFNSDRDGVWFEGTAQMAVAYAWAGGKTNLANAAALTATLRQAQQIPAPAGNKLGMVAASHDAVSTGFLNFDLYRRPHIGATAWNIFAQQRFNPYYQTRAPALPRR